MIKKWNKFNENSFKASGLQVRTNKSKHISITDEQIDMFSDNSSLQKLVADEKVSILGNKVWYNDEKTKEVLDQYLKEEINPLVGTKVTINDAMIIFLNLSKEDKIKFLESASDRLNLVCISENEYNDLIDMKINYPG